MLHPRGMQKFMIAVVAAASLFTIGCKKKGGGGDTVAKMEEFQKKMCDCKDKACSDKVNEEMTKWGTEMAKTAGADKDAKPDPELAKKSADIMTKYTECMTKNMMAGAGSAEPVKKDEPKAEPPKDEPKADAPKDEPKKADAPKEEPKKEEPKKADGAKADPKKPDDKKAGGW
jgi:hypothetical protein